MKLLAFLLCVVVATFASIYTSAANDAQDLHAFAMGIVVAFSSIVSAALLAGMLIEAFIQRRRNMRNKNLRFVQCK